MAIQIIRFHDRNQLFQLWPFSEVWIISPEGCLFLRVGSSSLQGRVSTSDAFQMNSARFAVGHFPTITP